MARATSIGLALWIGILGCGAGDDAARPRAASDAPRAHRTSGIERLSPQLAAILAEGLGSRRAQRIVLHPSNAPIARSFPGLR
jgi:hypothetical protein